MEEDDHLISSTVDTCRPFSSVKEAVAIFGERLLVGELMYSNSSSPKPFISDQYTTTTTTSSPIVIKRQPSMLSSPTPITSPMKPNNKDYELATNASTLAETLKKLEAELDKTKAELKLLKERGTETEVALATLNAELHKNMSKLARAEATAAGKAATATKTVRFDTSENGEIIIMKEENKRDQSNNNNRQRRMEDSRTLAHILTLSSPLGENDHLFGFRPKKHRKAVLKLKPIIPLVGDFFFFKRNRASSSTKSP